MTPQTSNVPLEPRKPLWRRLLKWMVRIVVVLIVVGLVAWSAASYWAARAIRDEVARIRAAGQPVTFDELDASMPQASEEQDAGPYYTAAMALARNVSREGDDEAMDTGAIAPELLAEAQRRLEKNRLALDMLDRAALLPGCNSDVGLRYGVTVSLLRLKDARLLANVASLRTRTLASQGKGDEAAKSAISSLRMVRIFQRQPVLITYLVQIGCLARFGQDVQIILEHGGVSPSVLESLDKTMADAERLLDFERVCVAERVYYLEMMRSIVAGGRELQQRHPYDVPPLPEQQQWPNNLGVRIMVAQVLPIYTRFVDAAAKGFPQVIDAMNALAIQPRSRFDMWAGIIAPSLHRATINAARGLAIVRTARIAVQIEQYRLAHGQLPQSLDQLPHPVPPDPFNGQSLIYRTVPGGYVVYSVGENRRDDGGTDLRNRKKADDGIMVRLPAP